MNNVFVFDVDNTITPPRQQISEDMKYFFQKFILINKVYLVSGSDFEKISWQLGKTITDSVTGVFACLGNVYIKNNTLIKQNKFPQLSNQDLIYDIEQYIKNSSTPLRTGNHVEERIAMLNISTIGRNASLEQRKIYSQFDKQINERQIFADYLKNKYPDLDISIGGEISIDISVKGFSKEQVYKQILSENKKAKIIFFGDRCNVGGNDYTLAKTVTLDNGLVFNVESYVDTKLILEKIWKDGREV